MADFMTRVELHSANWEDYDKLHVQMKVRGFSQRITSDKGTMYELPPAEYYYSGSVTKSDVLASAKTAAQAVKTSFAVVVTESNGVTWHGLKQVAVA